MNSTSGGTRLGRGTLKLLAPLFLRMLPRRRSAKQGEEFKFFTHFALGGP